MNLRDLILLFTWGVVCANRRFKSTFTRGVPVWLELKDETVYGVLLYMGS